MDKIYILKKDCPNIGKEVGDYYNNEYRESIEELLEKGVIGEECDHICTTDCRHEGCNCKCGEFHKE